MQDSKGRQTLRTPDERFKDLEDYPFLPNYVELDGLRMHYVEEGPKDGDVILLLHGEPSWSYLYRKMIPILANAGYRVIAPDLIGFGKSDKFIQASDYSFQFHVDIIGDFIKALDLKDINLFCQDWGGLIGLRLAAEMGDRFARIIAGNTSIAALPPKHKNLPLRQKIIPLTKAALGFSAWYTYARFASELHISSLINAATTTRLNREIRRAYDAPYPDNSYKAGAHVFPQLVPTQFKQCKAAWDQLAKWEKPFLTVFSDKDPIAGSLGILFEKIVPGAQGVNHRIIKDAGHFLQEDKGEELAELTVQFIKTGNI